MTPHTCEVCAFWQRRREGGDCRINPPSLVFDGDASISAWPQTEADDWCGQWVPVGVAPWSEERAREAAE